MLQVTAQQMTPTALNETPLISVVTPYRNAERFLPGLSATLQAQTYPHWECLLVDHASSDGGPALAAQLAAADPRFRCLQELDPRPLPALPRNRALAAARGELIAFLDADDLWHPQKLERQLAFHLAGQLDLSVTAYGRFHASGSAPPDGLPRRWRRTCPPARISHQRLLWGNPIPILTVLLNRELLAGQVFASHHHEDYLLWLRLWRRRPQLRFGLLPEVLAFHRRHGANLTAQRWRMLSWTYRVYRADGQPPLAAAFRACRFALLRTLTAAAGAAAARVGPASVGF